MAPPPLLMLQDIHVNLGSTPLLRGAELAVSQGERICLIGRNGSGKSTLLKIAAGLMPMDQGSRFIQPGATIRYLPQEPDLSAFPSTLAYVEDGMGPGDDPYRAISLLGALGLSGEEKPARLSGGEARRAALARALAPAPDLLLLDEPTNHLDLPAIEWLEEELGRMRAGLVIISHDRRLLLNLSRSLIWLDRGTTRRIDRGFAAYEDWREELLAQEEAEHHKLSRQIAREEDWMRYGVTARRKRNVRRVGELAALRQQYRERNALATGTRMAASEAEGSGKLVFVAEGLGKSYDRPVVRDLDLRVLRGDRLGIIGPNGAGKSTLLGLLTGRIAPDTGQVKIGTNLEMVTLDQQRASLDPARTLAETLTDGHGELVQVGSEKRHVIGYMKDFMFKPEQARTPVGTLSGGERGRLLLACALARPSNLLILDEPTNDLDFETLDLLQEMLADYAGTVLLVSHDRDFLDRVVTSTLAAEGDGRWTEYAGGYSDMLAQRRADLPPRAAPATVRKSAPGASPDSPPPPAASRKMSFKDVDALKKLPAQMDKLQAEIARLQGTLADPGLYARDPKSFAATTAKLGEAEAALAAAEERWLELEMLREDLAG
ncbi:ATP-binding cassette domain-containing protein [Acidisoma sp. C75]